ncbi:2-keto-4-pentenoate hydratase [Mesorhizobium sp. J428]|uniref:2-keto-4-pentenoate hydratase n=1 Tax=Mesorhizobium sp. J428 TaxID=2898440 RepID=UPI00215099B6|nr:hypothetical protein [Mesorhizobium sp. J428]MCR5856309.1 hypothetical protein [Mesorhizobium sp. J428]
MSDLARRIVDDIVGLRPFAPREDEIKGLTHAYEVQREVNDKLIKGAPGRRIVGYKIAFNRRSSMDYYGLSESCYAPLFSDQVHASGAELALAGFVDLVIEPEIALRLIAPVETATSVKDLEHAVEALPAIEIMDARGAFAHDPSAAAAVAQRIHSEGAVLGTPVPFVASADTAVRLSIDGTVAGEARNAAPQQPLEALNWLVSALARDGKALEPGMVVLTGAHLPGRAITSPGVIRVEITPFGDVVLQLRP